MNKKTTAIIIFGCIAIILGILFSFSLSKKKQKKSTEPTLLVAANPPAVTLTQNAPQNVKFSFSGENQPSPSELPVYPYIWNHVDMTSLAKAFGFTVAPEKLGGTLQSTVSWKTSSSSLSVYTDSTSDNVAYILSTKTSPQITAGDAASINLFIKTVFSPPQQYSLVFSGERSGPFDGLQITDTQYSDLRAFSYKAYVDSIYPLANASFDIGTAVVIIDASGVIRSLSYITPPTITEKGINKQILTVKEAISSLNLGKGLLVSSGTNGDTAFWGHDPDFSSVVLTKYSLIYYPDAEQLLLRPFYFFNGVATATDGTQLEVEYTVSATE